MTTPTEPAGEGRAAHTPLPWKISRGRDNLIDGPRGAVANCVFSHSASPNRTLPTGDECVANAAYIVRACNSHPDLVAALEAALAAMLNHAGWDLNFDPSGVELPMTRPTDVQAAEALALAALAKAKL